MSVHLTQSQIARLGALSRLLLAPLGTAGTREWLERINEELVGLTGAERALSALPMRDPGAVVVHGFDPGVIPAFLEGPVDEDPALALVMEQRPPVIHQRMVYGEEFERLPLFNDFLRPWGIVNSAGMNAFLPGGGLALASVMTGETVDVAFQLRSHALLALVQPSFEAGVATLVRVGYRGGRLARLLDALVEPVALYDAEGGRVHANLALVEALRPDPEAEDVWAWLDGVARDRLEGGGDDIVTLDAVRVFRTGWQSYRAMATTVAEDVLGREPGVLVRVELQDRARAAADRLIARYGLTEREAEVATHLGRGEADREIAERLGISWHTVRTHVERVLGKLGVDSRGKVIRVLEAARRGESGGADG